MTMTNRERFATGQDKAQRKASVLLAPNMVLCCWLREVDCIAYIPSYRFDLKQAKKLCGITN